MAERGQAERLALIAAELRHYLRLVMELDDRVTLRNTVRKRVTEVIDGLAPGDQGWFIAVLGELSEALRGAGRGAQAMQTVFARMGGPQTEAGAALLAPPRHYRLTKEGGAGFAVQPRVMLAFALGEIARSWKPKLQDGGHAAQLQALLRRGLSSETAPAVLEAAQTAWRDDAFNEAWDNAVRRLRELYRSSRFPWGPNQVALMAALLAPDRIEGSPWLGPLKAELHAALMEGGGWEAVLRQLAAGDGGAKPGKSFAKSAAAHIAEIGADAFRARVVAWLEAHPLDPELPDPDGDALKQLIWMLGTTGEAAAGPLGRFAQRCFIKVPNIGARSVKLGNAALAALGLVEPPSAGAAELDRLRQRVKYPSAQKQIEAALQAAAKRAGMTAEDLAELAVPDFDLDGDGAAGGSEAEGGATLRLVAGRQVALEWRDGGGKPVSAAPAALKQAHPALVKHWTERKRALEAMLSGQISRIEGFYETARDWDGAAWVARYARHALLGPLSRRLIWRLARADGSAAAFLAAADGLVDADGRAVNLGGGDRVRLWHPIDASVDEVLAWRASIVARGVVQPFKQAHREIYRLTDAERDTATYSNRFGGHILRQHQMLALAKSRGWTGTLQGSFDGANDPSKDYPAHGLRVAMGSEGIEGHESDLSPHGICIRVATGPVIFHRLAPPMTKTQEREALWVRVQAMRAGQAVPALPGPVALAAVPPLLFSEAMRDVDLFVGVTSLGADPAWLDGGPDGRFGDYWRGYAEAELAESGRARHAVLAAILPRLNIAGVCTLEPRHLVVRGRLKTYRIHIGSGSIFFQPEGQYLCIVPARAGAGEDIVLPFEGDGMLSAILSKAMLLARDDLIKDRSILSQLRILPGTARG